MVKKKVTKSDSLLQKKIDARMDVKFQEFKSAFLFELDKQISHVLEAIDKRNFDFRSDLATMKDEIIGEIKDMRHASL